MTRKAMDWLQTVLNRVSMNDFCRVSRCSLLGVGLLWVGLLSIGPLGAALSGTAAADSDSLDFFPSQKGTKDEFLGISSKVDSYFRDAEASCDSITFDSSLTGVPSQRTDWEVLPDGLLWHSYLAGPQEPRISAVIFGDTDGGVFWDATLGGRFGFLRYQPVDSPTSRAWQWDMEGAVITRLDLMNAEDVESMDYRFGTEITTAQGPWAAKFGYFHISSHVGDEYLIRNPTYQRVNYVTESFVLGVSYSAEKIWRIYGESAYAFKASGGAKPWQFQTGMEYTPHSKWGKVGAPFSAINVDIREAVDYDPSITVQTGWSWQGPYSDRRLRVGLQYASGPTSQFQFFLRRQEYLGGGIWFDY